MVRSAQAIESNVTQTARDLYVSLQLRYPQVATVFLAGVSCSGSEKLCRALVSTISAVQSSAHIVVLGMAEGDGQAASFGDTHRLADIAYVREFVRDNAGTGYLFAATDDFLTDPNAMVWSSVLDGVVLLIRRGRTRQRELEAARQRLAESGAALLGSVFLEKPIS